ncbi:MAG: histidine phosphatase family protein [Pseudomonadota bacterium]
MDRLILMRHSKTEPWFEGVDDHGRALTTRGTADALLVAQALARAGAAPRKAILSTSRRTRETWAALSGVFRKTEVDYSDDLYLAMPEQIEELLQAETAAGTVLLLGHNPGLYDFSCSLARRGGAESDLLVSRLREKFPTSCCAIFEASSDGPYAPDRFKLVDVIRARDLRAP